ncbi:transmembrane protein with metallophosphoesterase domain isoform X2 [Narcine bancroftii]|uniref:transmembrane protein with metallophosphoesterase domain isoform X2 n=1 Tax=Narcine bancroftii TaxID=1343680 RepID=UPI00383222DA
MGRLPWQAGVSLAAAAVLVSMAAAWSVRGRIEQLTLLRVLRVQALLLLNTLMAAATHYIWSKAAAGLHGPRPGPPSRGLRAWRATLAAFLLLAHSSSACLLTLVSEEPHPLSLLCYSCLGAYVFLLFSLLACGALDRARGCVSRTPSARPGLALAVALSFTLVCTVLGLLNGRLPPVVKRVELPLHKLPQSFHQLKMVLLSDIHLGPTVGRSKLQMVVNMVNDLNPDIVVIVGDLTDSQVVNLRTATEPLRQLMPKLGTYFVTGNHDYYSADVANWLVHLQSLNIRPLHNEHVKIYSPRGNKDWFCLAGVDDIEADMLQYPEHGMDLNKALDGCSSEDTIVLLAHQPAAAKRALQSRPDISLVLCGECYGGIANFSQPVREGE